MVPLSPAEALGIHSHDVRDLLVEVIRSRHDRAVESHVVSGSRYAMGFGSQWRDLIDDTDEAFSGRGCQSHRLSPAGYQLPVVNDCLVYVWRVPSVPGAVAAFASSPTRAGMFTSQPPAPMLFGGGPGEEPAASAEDERFGSLVRAMGESMPVVLVMIHSSPHQLQSIEWAVAELDNTGQIKLHGRERIWEPEVLGDLAGSDVESFDHGAPVHPVVEPRELEGVDPDAR